MISEGASRGTPNPDQKKSVSGPSSSAAGIPRELLRWLQGLDLDHPFKSLKRDFANGYIFAEILSRFYPKEIHMPAFYSGSSSSAKRNNWDQLEKFFRKTLVGEGGMELSLAQKLRVSKELIDLMEKGNELALLKLLMHIYEHVNRRKMLASTSQYMASTSSMPSSYLSPIKRKSNRLPSNAQDSNGDANEEPDEPIQQFGNELQKERDICKELTSIMNIAFPNQEFGLYGEDLTTSDSFFRWLDIVLKPDNVKLFLEAMQSHLNPSEQERPLYSFLCKGLANDIYSSSFQVAYGIISNRGLNESFETFLQKLHYVLSAWFSYNTVEDYLKHADDIFDKVPYALSMVFQVIKVRDVAISSILPSIFEVFAKYHLSLECWCAFLLKLMKSSEVEASRFILCDLMKHTLSWIYQDGSVMFSQAPWRFSVLIFISALLENREFYLSGDDLIAVESRDLLNNILTFQVPWDDLIYWVRASEEHEKVVNICLYFMTMVCHTDPESYEKKTLQVILKSSWNLISYKAFTFFLQTLPRLLENDQVLCLWLESIKKFHEEDKLTFSNLLLNDSNGSSTFCLKLDVNSSLEWETNIPVSSLKDMFLSNSLLVDISWDYISKVPLDDNSCSSVEFDLSLMKEIFKVHPKASLKMKQKLSAITLKLCFGLVQSNTSQISIEIIKHTLYHNKDDQSLLDKIYPKFNLLLNLKKQK